MTGITVDGRHAHVLPHCGCDAAGAQARGHVHAQGLRKGVPHQCTVCQGKPVAAMQAMPMSATMQSMEVAGTLRVSVTLAVGRTRIGSWKPELRSSSAVSSLPQHTIA